MLVGFNQNILELGLPVIARHSQSRLLSDLRDRLIAPADQAFSAPSGVCGRANARSWANGPVNPQHPGPAATFFSAADKPVLPLSFSFGLDRGHAHSGGAPKRRMAASMARTIGTVTATSTT